MNKKQISWAFYDWANSAFSTTIMAGFFPIFFKQYWSAGDSAAQTTAALGLTLSISGFLNSISSPFLGALADVKGLKKKLCGSFMILGVLGCVGLSVIPAGGWTAAMIVYGITLFAFSASNVFYDSLLPALATGKKSDQLSALGYALGYLGGGVLFSMNVFMFLKPSFFGLADGVSAVRWSFASVGLWWFIFSLPMFLFVQEPHSRAELDKTSSLKKLLQTVRAVVADKNLMIFVISFWLYIDGVYTVMAMAVDYGMSIGLESTDLIKALLVVQFIGFPSTYIFGSLTKNYGSRMPILFCIGIYSVAVLLAAKMSVAWHFYALAVVIGLVQGGVQSLSRSLFARLIPADQAGEYFGFFNLIGKFASVLGPLIVALTVTITGESRGGMAGLVILFIVGGYLLYLVQEPQEAPLVDQSDVR
jgi:MFS transporter, UMF1 family